MIKCLPAAWISKVLEEKRSDWVLWVDIDTVILDADFELPYHQYFGQSKDLVIYGNRTMVKAGHPIQGNSLSHKTERRAHDSTSLACTKTDEGRETILPL